MVALLIVVAVVVVAVLGVLLLRSTWRDAATTAAAAPTADERSRWPFPQAVGDRVMWCPMLARKVILADTMLDDGAVGTVVDLDGRGQPSIEFDDGGRTILDKWGAARVVPAGHEPRRARPLPPKAKRKPAKRSSGKRRR